ARPRRTPSGAMTPLCNVESPRRTISLARSRTLMRPPVSTSATMRWNELDPTSRAAIRIPIHIKRSPVAGEQQVGEETGARIGILRERRGCGVVTRSEVPMTKPLVLTATMLLTLAATRQAAAQAGPPDQPGVDVAVRVG